MNIEPVSLTKKAAKEVLKIKHQKQIGEQYALRIDVKGNASGCGAFGFKIGFDTKQESDLEYTNHNVKMFIDKKKALFLMNVVVDYLFEDGKEGFFFDKKETAVLSK